MQFIVLKRAQVNLFNKDENMLRKMLQRKKVVRADNALSSKTTVETKCIVGVKLIVIGLLRVIKANLGICIVNLCNEEI